MSSTFKKIKHGSNDFYIKVDKNDGVIIVEPGSGSITLNKATVQSMLDFRRSFAYVEAIRRRQITANSILPVTLEQFSEQTNNGVTYLVVIQYNLAQKLDMPQISFKTINVNTGDVEYKLELPGGVTDQLFREISSAGLKTDTFLFTNIQYVKSLPDETIASSKAVYRIGSKLYKLNDEQDGFVELEGTFVRVRRLYEFTTSMQENVLYDLTVPYKDEFGNEFDRGVYTYTKSTNTVVKTDKVLYLIKKLPAISEAKENYIYILTRDDLVNNKNKNTKWRLNEQKTDYIEDNSNWETLTRLPYSPLAVSGTFYILNDDRLFKALEGKYDNLGHIVDTKELPDVSKTIIDDKTVYVLTEKVGNKAKGSKWIFDTVDKQFVEYTDGYKGHQEPKNSEIE